MTYKEDKKRPFKGIEKEQGLKETLEKMGNSKTKTIKDFAIVKKCRVLKENSHDETLSNFVKELKMKKMRSASNPKRTLLEYSDNKKTLS